MIERWDVELNVVYEMNSRLDYFRIGVPGRKRGGR